VSTLENPDGLDLPPLTVDEVFAMLAEAKVRFWQCPDHRGRPHLVEWVDDIAHCVTCGRTSDQALSENTATPGTAR
jgi:hypothetical protein